MKRPRLPWEVIERMIEHSGDHPKALSSFSLTCHQLRPRSCRVRFAQVEFRSRDHVLAFINMLQDNPDVKLFVRSMVIQPNVLSSFPLLHMLPHLSEITFRQQSWLRAHPDCPPPMYQSSLTYFRRFGSHIRSLHLFGLCFVTTLPFARLLLALPNIVHLSCTKVNVEMAGHGEHLDLIKRRLSEQMRLETLTVSDPKLVANEESSSVGSLLVDRFLVSGPICPIQRARVCGRVAFVFRTIYRGEPPDNRRYVCYPWLSIGHSCRSLTVRPILPPYRSRSSCGLYVPSRVNVVSAATPGTPVSISESNL